MTIKISALIDDEKLLIAHREKGIDTEEAVNEIVIVDLKKCSSSKDLTPAQNKSNLVKHNLCSQLQNSSFFFFLHPAKG